jgi:hypothetical protein
MDITIQPRFVPYLHYRTTVAAGATRTATDGGGVWTLVGAYNSAIAAEKAAAAATDGLTSGSLGCERAIIRVTAACRYIDTPTGVVANGLPLQANDSIQYDNGELIIPYIEINNTSAGDMEVHVMLYRASEFVA